MSAAKDGECLVKMISLSTGTAASIDVVYTQFRSVTPFLFITEYGQQTSWSMG